MEVLITGFEPFGGNATNPTQKLCTGLSAEARSLLAERIAVNEQAGTDNDALTASGGKVDAAGTDGLFATIDTARLSGFLTQRGLRTDISWHAGTYVCNTALYTAVQSAGRYGGKAGFLHVPADVDVRALAAALSEWAASELAAAG